MNDKPPKKLSTAGDAVILLMLLAFVYVGSFVYLSRYGYRERVIWANDDYFFAEPITSAGGERHLLLARFFWPLVELDANWITGRRPGPTLSQIFSCVDIDANHSR